MTQAVMQTPWERERSSRGPSWLYAGSGHLRAIWRLLAFGVAIMLAYGILAGSVAPLMGSVSVTTGVAMGSYTWLELGAIGMACVVVVRHVDAIPWSSMGMNRAHWRAPVLARGLGLGALAIATTTLLLLLLQLLHFQRNGALALLDGNSPAQSPVATWLVTSLRLASILAPAALSEELVFRGYLWRVAEDAVGQRTALWSTSVAFGLAHITNPGANARTLGLVIVAGLCLGQVRVTTGSLPAAWAAHFAWNWFMAAILHVPVSGLPMSSPQYEAVTTGPAWLSGGDWGPEGGAIAATVLGSALLIVHRKHLIPLVIRTRTRFKRAEGVHTGRAD